MSGNQLSGSIPPSVVNFCLTNYGLKWDFSGNNGLTGYVASSLKDQFDFQCATISPEGAISNIGTTIYRFVGGSKLPYSSASIRSSFVSLKSKFNVIMNISDCDTIQTGPSITFAKTILTKSGSSLIDGATYQCLNQGSTLFYYFQGQLTPLSSSSNWNSVFPVTSIDCSGLSVSSNTIGNQISYGAIFSINPSFSKRAIIISDTVKTTCNQYPNVCQVCYNNYQGFDTDGSDVQGCASSALSLASSNIFALASLCQGDPQLNSLFVCRFYGDCGALSQYYMTSSRLRYLISLIF